MTSYILIHINGDNLIFLNDSSCNSANIWNLYIISTKFNRRWTGSKTVNNDRTTHRSLKCWRSYPQSNRAGQRKRQRRWIYLYVERRSIDQSVRRWQNERASATCVVPSERRGGRVTGVTAAERLRPHCAIVRYTRHRRQISQRRRTITVSRVLDDLRLHRKRP